MARSSDIQEECVCIWCVWFFFYPCVCVVLFINCAPFPITYLSNALLCGFHKVVEREQDIRSQERRFLREFAKDMNIDP